MGDGKLVMEGSLTKTGGIITTTEATLKLAESVSLSSNTSLSFQALELNGNTLTIGEMSVAPEDGLVAYYPFNETANDESTNGNHATVNGAGYTTDRQGITNKTLTLNGTSDYLSVPSGTSLDMGEQLTMSAWVYPTDNGWSNIAMRGNYGYGFALSGNATCGSSNRLVYWDQSVCGNNIYSTLTYTLNTWQHVAVTVEDIGTQLRIYFYLNGVQDGPYYSDITAINNGGTSKPLYIAEQGECFCNYFGGNLDELRIWSVVRTQ